MLARGRGVRKLEYPKKTCVSKRATKIPFLMQPLPLTGIVLISQRSPIIECIAKTWTPEHKCSHYIFRMSRLKNTVI